MICWAQRRRRMLVGSLPGAAVIASTYFVTETRVFVHWVSSCRPSKERRLTPVKWRRLPLLLLNQFSVHEIQGADSLQQLVIYGPIGNLSELFPNGTQHFPCRNSAAYACRWKQRLCKIGYLSTQNDVLDYLWLLNSITWTRNDMF